MVPFLFRIKRLINSSYLDSSQCIYIPYSSYFSFVINGHLDCYPRVLVTISNSHQLFIPIQHANHVMEIFT